MLRLNAAFPEVECGVGRKMENSTINHKAVIELHYFT